MSFYRNMIGQIRPEVERPTAKTTIWRVLELGALLIIIAALAAAAAAWWLLNAGRVIGQWIGIPLIVLVLLYGVEVVTLRWPPTIVWRETAMKNKRTILALLGIGILATILWASGNWPEPSYPQGNFLWLHYKLWPNAGWSTGTFVIDDGVQSIIEVSCTYFLWARLILAIVLPIAVPWVMRLIWYRFSVEIVYPSWSDGAIPRGLQWLDPLHLLDIHLSASGDNRAETAPASARPDGRGAL